MVKQKSRGIKSLPKRFDGWAGSYVDDGSDDQSDAETRRLNAADGGADESAAETARLKRLNGGNVTDDNQTAAETARLTRLNEIKTASPELWDKVKDMGSSAFDKLLNKYTKNGSLDFKTLAEDFLPAGAALFAANQASKPIPKTGYQGKIPKYTAVSGTADEPGAGFRPGQGGHQYFTGLSFADPNADQSGPQGLAAIQAGKATELANLNTANKARDAAYAAAHPAYVNDDPNGDKFFGRTDKTDLVDGPGKVYTNATVGGGAKTDTSDPFNAMYQQVLGRNADTEGLKYWKERFGPTLEADELAQFKKEAAPDELSHLYEQQLGRKADEAGLKYWQDRFGPTMTDEERAQFRAEAAPQEQAHLAEQNKSQEVGGKGSLINDELLLDRNMPLGRNSTEPVVGGKDSLPPTDNLDMFGEDQKRPGMPGGLSWESLNDTKYLGGGMGGSSVAASGIGSLAPKPNVLPPETGRFDDREFTGFGDTGRNNGGTDMEKAGIANLLKSQQAQQAITRPPESFAMARGGTTSPRGTYLQGATDGMADKIPGTIDGIQPARLAHGEFVIPADVVSHLGNGNSDAGAQQLYKMMDKVRMARTGNKEQGKRINPNKFMPGGLANLHSYAQGGTIRFANEGSVPTGTPSGIIGQEQGLSDWAGDYVTDMLGKSQALVNQKLAAPDVYKGELSAGDSALQQRAYANAANLGVPSSIAQAANTAGALAGRMANLSYEPTTVQNAYEAPQNLGYTAERANAAQTGYAPTLQNYQMAGPEKVKTEKFIDQGTAQAYMSPYMQQVIENQQRDAQRQADIAATTRHAGATQAGAFGGSRQAIMDAEAARNLAQQKGDIQAQGLQNAFTNAQQQFNAEQGYGLQGQIANQNAGVNVGGQNLNANLAVQQLGTQTGLQTALANLGNQQQMNLANQNAANQAAQFGAGQNLTSAQTAAQYGQAANALNAQNAQFGAQYGLNALQGAQGAAQAQGQLGATQGQAGIAALNAQLAAGNQQQATNQAGIAAQKAAFEEQKMDPYNQLNFQKSMIGGMPITSTSYNFLNDPVTAAAGAASTVNKALGNNTATPSDRRLKEDINRVGTHEATNLPLYTFRYIKDPSKQFLGFMADDVEQKYPEMVSIMPNGYKAVNYGGLGTQMLEVKE